MYEVVIMAGKDDNSTELQEYSDCEYKTLIKLNNRTIIEHMMDELESSGVVRSYHIMGIPLHKIPNWIRGRVNVHIHATPDLDYIDRLMYAIDNIQDDKFLLVNGDLPFLRRKTILEFIDKCDESFDANISFISKEVMETQFPQSKRTYSTLKEGKFCFGDFHMVSKKEIRNHIMLIQSIRNNRKNFVKVLIKVRLRTVIRYVIGKMNIPRFQAEVLRVTGTFIRPVIMEDAGIGMDIDKPFQLDIARKMFFDQRLFSIYVQSSGSRMTE